MRYVFFLFIVFYTVLNTAAAEKKPKITGQKPLSTRENTALTIKLSDLEVSDKHYPDGYELLVFTGDHYSVQGNTIIPEPGFTGTLKVQVSVKKGREESKKYDLKVDVLPIQQPENIKPIITGQQAVSIEANQSVAIELSQLTVQDPDNNYPQDFHLIISEGDNYTVVGKVVTPTKNFAGVLAIGVRVNDGSANSDVFSFKVTVLPGKHNEPPVITGQAGLTTREAESLKLEFTHLVVKDPDNNYPQDFTMTVAAGNHYTVNGHTITPENGFIGSLTVPVTVNDGTSTSAAYNLKVNVIQKSSMEITGQKPLAVNEDESITISLSDLLVNDPSDRYPQGFSLQVMTGDHYTFKDQTITPTHDFFGNLPVTVTVSNGARVSNPFSLMVIVNPVNDPPVLTEANAQPVGYAMGVEPVQVIAGAEITDVDDTDIVYAEIALDAANYQPGGDQLLVENTELIHAVFDTREGILSLIGTAPLSHYQDVLRSIRYSFTETDSISISGDKTLSVTLNDGKSVSEPYTKTISLSDNLSLDIPNAFTPNHDNANDTWKIRPLRDFLNASATIKVYNEYGVLVHEAHNFTTEWDGTFNGQNLPASTYFYTIEVDLSYTRKSYKGVVTILR
jgi:gliding motility-associated-like protein